MLEVKEINFKNLSPHKDPHFAHEGDSGFDLRAWIENQENKIVLKPLERTLIHTGLYFYLTSDVEMQIRPRSGLSLNTGLMITNSPATIDCRYTGEIGIIICNVSNQDVIINDGDRIAQGVIMPVYNSYKVNLNRKTEDYSIETERGENGFGSSGLK